MTAGVQALHPGPEGACHSEPRSDRPEPVGMGDPAAIAHRLLDDRRDRARGPSRSSALGRAEDPIFTFRTMIVFAGWPGATLEETLLQVTERIERKLQETRHLERVRSYTTAGVTTIFVDLKQSTPPDEVPDIWYQVRKNIGDIRGTLPAGVVGPGFNDDFGDTYGIIYGFSAEGFSHRELRDFVESARSRLLLVPDVSKIEILGRAERAGVPRVLHRAAGGPRSDLFAACWRSCRRRTWCVRPACCRPATSASSCACPAPSIPRPTSRRSTSSVGDRIIPLRDIAEVRRGLLRSAAAAVPRQRQGLDRARHRHARRRRHPGARRATSRRRWPSIRANLPVGVEPFLVSDQAVTVDLAINDFMTSLWQAILIILAASFISLGVRPGSVVALAIPLTLAIVFAVMVIVRHRPAAHLARRADHRADPAGRRRDDHGGRDDPPARGGRFEGGGRDLRLQDTGCADAGRHADHDRGLRPHRVRAQLGGRVHVLDLRGGRALR